MTDLGQMLRMLRHRTVVGAPHSTEGAPSRVGAAYCCGGRLLGPTVVGAAYRGYAHKGTHVGHKGDLNAHRGTLAHTRKAALIPPRRVNPAIRSHKTTTGVCQRRRLQRASAAATTQRGDDGSLCRSHSGQAR